MDAIIYTSNAGSTKQYAQMLGGKLQLPVFSMSAAKDKVKPDAKIIYLGWVMANGVKGYEQAAKKYEVCAVCAVGMARTGTNQKAIREKNLIPSSTKLFTLQGNFEVDKLHGLYKMMMKMMVKKVGKTLAEKKDRTPDEEDMLDMMTRNGKRVSEKNLESIAAWYQAEK